MSCACGVTHRDGDLYYVSVARDEDGGGARCALGPYQTHAEALDRVRAGRALVSIIDDKSPWYYYGTLSLPQDGDQPPVVFSAQDLDLLRFWRLGKDGALGDCETRVPVELLAELGLQKLDGEVSAMVVAVRNTHKIRIMANGQARTRDVDLNMVMRLAGDLIVRSVAARRKRNSPLT